MSWKKKTLGRKFSDQHCLSGSHLTLDPQDAFLKKASYWFQMPCTQEPSLGISAIKIPIGFSDSVFIILFDHGNFLFTSHLFTSHKPSVSWNTLENTALDTDQMGPFYLCKESERKSLCQNSENPEQWLFSHTAKSLKSSLYAIKYYFMKKQEFLFFERAHKKISLAFLHLSLRAGTRHFCGRGSNSL